MLAIAAMLGAFGIGREDREPVARAHTNGIPAGLARAIHARLGPGAIALGHAPLSAGIEAATRGWKAKASAQSLAARIAPDGTVSAHLAGFETVSLTPISLSGGGALARLSTGRALFRDGRLLVRLSDLLEGAPDLFEDRRRKTRTEENNQEELFEQIGRLKMEVEWLKKKSAQLG